MVTPGARNGELSLVDERDQTPSAAHVVSVPLAERLEKRSLLDPHAPPEYHRHGHHQRGARAHAGPPGARPPEGAGPNSLSSAASADNRTMRSNLRPIFSSTAMDA